MNKILHYTDLRERGICYTRVHLRRLMRAGKFPAAMQLSDNRVGWFESDISTWLAARPVAAGATRSDAEAVEAAA